MELHHSTRAIAPLTMIAGFILAGCAARPYAWHGTAYENPPSAPGLPGAIGTDQSSPLGLPGHVSLVYFGYAHCTDFCPATLAMVADLFAGLGSEADNVRFYFVTVDPERDTGEALSAYLDQFDSRFIGVRPDAEALQLLLAGYGATSFVDPAQSAADAGVISHTTRVFLVDRAGKMRAHYPSETSAVDLLADVRYLLREG